MKSLSMRLVTSEGDELDCIPVDEFLIADEWDDSPVVDEQEDILARVDALFTSLLQRLRERQAAPRRGSTALRLALGRALLTADEMSDNVVVEVLVRPLTAQEALEDEAHDAEETKDEFDESDEG